MITRGSSAWKGHSHFAKGTGQGNFTRCGSDLVIFITKFILDDSCKTKQIDKLLNDDQIDDRRGCIPLV